MSELQPFEKITDLRDNILYAANNWKINKGWTNHLSIINRLCEEREQMLEMLKRSIEEIHHLKYEYNDKGHSIKYLKEANQLIQQATTIK